MLLAQFALAHGPLHEQIEDVSRDIERDPQSATLYLKRGELYRLHRDWQAALSDYDRAAKLDSKLAAVDLARGQMYVDAEWPKPALEYLTRFIAANPTHDKALALRARARAMQKDYAGAADDFTAAIAHASIPNAELYIDRAHAISARGTDFLDAALNSLDEGIARMGHVVTLEFPAIELEVSLKRFDAALKRLDLLAAQSERQESWLVRKGDILKSAGRTDEARNAYRQALLAIAALPERFRNTQAVKDLQEKVQKELQAGVVRSE